MACPLGAQRRVAGVALEFHITCSEGGFRTKDTLLYLPGHFIR